MSLFFVQEVVKEILKQEIYHMECFYQNYIKILPHWWPGKTHYFLLETDHLQREQNFKFLIHWLLQLARCGRVKVLLMTTYLFQSWKQWKTGLRHISFILPIAQEKSFSPPLLWQMACSSFFVWLLKVPYKSLFPSPHYWGIFSVLSPHYRIFAVVSKPKFRAQMSPVIKLYKTRVEFQQFGSYFWYVQ